ncbi:MAG: response regulator [Candidatus Paceibacterota bacterium]
MTKEPKKVFIVDDDYFLLNMYSLKFKNNGMEVEVAGGSDEALEKLEGGLKPDIILLDIIMPGTDGLTLLKEIRERKLAEDSFVIMLTNQGLQEDMDKAKELDVDGYIVKATSIPSEVVAEVEKIVSKNES